jgi:shikimate dehydrogenase
VVDARVAALVSNPLDVPADQAYSAILGLNPSRGARSPALWNGAFAAHGAATRMVALDVAPADVPALLAALEGDPRFLGGAVTAPHKVVAREWLADRVDPVARRCGAVNALSRDDAGHLQGANTDGEAALRTIRAHVPELEPATVVVLGAGGVARAVVAAVASASPETTVVVVARRLAAAREVAGIAGGTGLAWSDLSRVLAGAAVVVQCTTLGSSSDQPDRSPLLDAELEVLPRTAFVFDVVYDPAPTALLAAAASRGLAVADGSEMNLVQAMLAFGHVRREPLGPEVTRTAMEEARRSLA